MPPMLVRTVSLWSRKSKLTWKVVVPCGTGPVVSPRAVTYSVLCQAWLIQGSWTRRTLPTIWVQRCRVS
jgi:hypothetical protein